MDEIEFQKDKNGNWTAHSKQYLKDENGEVRKAKAFSIIDNVFSQHGTNELLDLLENAHIFPFPKPTGLIKTFLEFGAPDKDSIVVDFFAGSATIAQALMELDAANDGQRRYILVQLPEPLDPKNHDQKIAADFCDSLGKPRTIAELTKERIRRAGDKIRDENPIFAGDLGFRVFKLDSSNIRAWEPERDDLEGTLLDSIDHIKPDRSEEDILYELLLKLGLDLCVPIENRTIAGKSVRSIGAGTLIACLDKKITREEVEPLTLGIAKWHDELSPAGDSTVVFRDSAFVDDVAKANWAAILKQNGLGNVRSL